MSFHCYLLVTTSGSHTYVGATTDPDRRLEQHNGKRSGGARATAIQVARGNIWKRVCVISGIPEWRSALQMEWCWKHLSRKDTTRHPLTKRLRALHALLALEKPTQTAIPYEAYPDGPPIIQWDSSDAEKMYNEMTGNNTKTGNNEMTGNNTKTGNHSTMTAHNPIASDPIPSYPLSPSESIVNQSIL